MTQKKKQCKDNSRKTRGMPPRMGFVRFKTAFLLKNNNSSPPHFQLLTVAPKRSTTTAQSLDFNSRATSPSLDTFLSSGSRTLIFQGSKSSEIHSTVRLDYSFSAEFFRKLQNIPFVLRCLLLV